MPSVRFGLTARFAALAVLALVTLLHDHTFAQSRFSGSIGTAHLGANGNGDWGRWGMFGQVQYRIGESGHLGLYAAHFLDNGARPDPSLRGAVVVESLSSLLLSYTYIAPSSGRLRPYFGLSFGPSFGTQRFFDGDQGITPVRPMVQESFTGATFRVPIGTVIRLSEGMQLDASFALQAVVLERQAQFMWPFQLGLRFGRW